PMQPLCHRGPYWSERERQLEKNFPERPWSSSGWRDVDVKILLCLAVEPRKAKPFTRLANLPSWRIFWVHLYERIERRTLARLRWRSGDCARIEPARSARRSARADGPKWLWKKHSGQGFGRAPRLPRDRR